MEELIKAILEMLTGHGCKIIGVEGNRRGFKCISKAADGLVVQVEAVAPTNVPDPYALVLAVRPAAALVEAPADAE